MSAWRFGVTGGGGGVVDGNGGGGSAMGLLGALETCSGDAVHSVCRNLTATCSHHRVWYKQRASAFLPAYAQSLALALSQVGRSGTPSA